MTTLDTRETEEIELEQSEMTRLPGHFFIPQEEMPDENLLGVIGRLPELAERSTAAQAELRGLEGSPSVYAGKVMDYVMRRANVEVVDEVEAYETLSDAMNRYYDSCAVVQRAGEELAGHVRSGLLNAGSTLIVMDGRHYWMSEPIKGNQWLCVGGEDGKTIYFNRWDDPNFTCALPGGVVLRTDENRTANTFDYAQLVLDVHAYFGLGDQEDSA